ncbi:MAG TPA: hypothetical protein VME01_11310 [Solirubrobacteraceae bacterium]|nr:hypothetical protein [Solirubrobacteraceae bacterium]
MGLTTSLVLIAIGAILRFAVTATTSGINVHTVGVILMIVGAVGFLIFLVWMVAANDRTAPRVRAVGPDEVRVRDREMDPRV